MDREIRVKVEIADETGHTQHLLTHAETMDVVNQNPEHWIFADGRLVKPADLAEADWGEVDGVILTSGLLGGGN